MNQPPRFPLPALGLQAKERRGRHAKPVNKISAVRDGPGTLSGKNSNRHYLGQGHDAVTQEARNIEA